MSATLDWELTGDKAALQGLCDVAALACRAPMAAVHRIDATGVRRGVGYGGAPIGASAAGSPCEHVVMTGRPVTCVDARTDPRFADTTEGLGGYAGAPILDFRGEPVGVVCVMDEQPRDFDASAVDALAALARQAAMLAELSQSRERLRALLDGLADAVIVTDGIDLVLVNAAYARLVGLPEEAAAGITLPQVAEAWGRTFPDLAPYDERAAIAHASGKPAEHEVKTAAGRVIARRYSPVYVDHRRAHLWQLRDVTGEREVEERSRSTQQRFAALANAAPVGIVATGPRGHVVFANPEFERLFPQETGRPWLQSVDDGDRERVEAEWWSAFLNRKPFAARYHVRDAEGQLREVEARMVPVLRDGDALEGFVGTIVDVTDAQETQRALARSLAAEQEERDRRLEAERSARLQAEATQADLAARNEELLALAQVKDNLVAAVSHELRTPLTSIQAFLEMLRDDDALTPAQVEALEVIERNARRLQRVVDDLLEFKRDVDAAELERAPVDLREVARLAVAAARPRAEAADIDLAVDGFDDAAAWADPERLPQALDCLIDNALKFTPSGGRVRVCVLRSGDRARVEVVDTGVGLSGDETERIFEPFYRGRASQAQARGSGLGLAIARRLVVAQGGIITAAGAPGKGSTFAIELDAVEA